MGTSVKDCELPFSHPLSKLLNMRIIGWIAAEFCGCDTDSFIGSLVSCGFHCHFRIEETDRFTFKRREIWRWGG